MKFVKAFIAGMVLPSIILPIFLFVSWATGKTELAVMPFFHILPLLWGLWNVLYFAFFWLHLPKEINFRYLLWGSILGLLVAIYGVFVLNLPGFLGLTEPFACLPLLVGPFIYAIFWRFVVKPLNDILGVRETEA